MGVRLSSAIAVFLMVSAFGAARAATHYPTNEVWFGVGGAGAFEKNLFNVPDDIRSTPEAAFSLGYMQNLDARRAVGFHIYGAGETTPFVQLQGPSGSQLVRFDLVTVNLGLRYRHTFLRSRFAPYLFAGVGAASGTLSSDATGDDVSQGFSACVGPGASVRLGRHFMLSAEGIGSFGAAKWEKLPAANSSGRKFNPSLVAGTINLSFVWGTERPSIPVPEPPAVRDSSLAADTPAVRDSSLAAAEVATLSTDATSPTRTMRQARAELVLLEACILFLSSAAYAGNRGGTLAGITAASALLGAAANASPEPPSPTAFKIIFGGLLGLAAAEFALGRAGATDDALFATSVVSLNVIAYATDRADRKAKMRRR